MLRERTCYGNSGKTAAARTPLEEKVAEEQLVLDPRGKTEKKT